MYKICCEPRLQGPEMIGNAGGNLHLILADCSSMQGDNWAGNKNSSPCRRYWHTQHSLFILTVSLHGFASLGTTHSKFDTCLVCKLVGLQQRVHTRAENSTATT